MNRPRALFLLEIVAVVEFALAIFISIWWPTVGIKFWFEICVAFVILLLYFRVTRFRATVAWSILVCLAILVLAAFAIQYLPYQLEPDALGIAEIGMIVLTLIGLGLFLLPSVRDWVWKKAPVAMQDADVFG